MKKIESEENTQENRKKKIVKKQKWSFKRLKTILFVLICTSLVVVCILNNVKLNELTYENSALKKDSNLLESDIVKLNVEIEKKTDLREIELKATMLGMSKLEKQNIEYINIPSSDKMVILKNENSNIVDSIFKNLSVILEYLS